MALLGVVPNFFVIEGLDGVGKTTLLNNLITKLGNSKIPHVIVTNHTINDFTNGLWDLVKNYTDSNDPRTSALMLLAIRNELTTKVIKPALLEGKLVICDRWHISTAIYQRDGVRDPSYLLREIPLLPQRTIILELPHEVAVARLEARGTGDKLETACMDDYVPRQEYMHKIVEHYSKEWTIYDTSEFDETQLSEKVFKELVSDYKAFLQA